MRIGIGYDSHAFCEGDHIIMGGIKIPFHKGIKAHSDGDVLLHAICDALLGAAGLEDLGTHFPDTDVKYANASSLELLKNIKNKLDNLHYSIINIDTIIIAEAPKFSNYKNSIIKNISNALLLPENKINIKAKTNEKMGWIGRGEGIASQAVVLININRINDLF